MSDPKIEPLIPLLDRDNVDRGNYVTRTTLQWLTSQLPIDGTSPKHWPVRTGSEADPFTRAIAAAQWVLRRYGPLLAGPAHPKRHVIRLWAHVRSDTIVALEEEIPPREGEGCELLLIQNSRGGVTLLFPGEFESLPADKHLRNAI